MRLRGGEWRVILRPVPQLMRSAEQPLPDRESAVDYADRLGCRYGWPVQHTAPGWSGDGR